MQAYFQKTIIFSRKFFFYIQWNIGCNLFLTVLWDCIVNATICVKHIFYISQDKFLFVKDLFYYHLCYIYQIMPGIFSSSLLVIRNFLVIKTPRNISWVYTKNLKLYVWYLLLFTIILITFEENI